MNDKRLRVWDVKTGKERRRLEGDADIHALSADGRVLATWDRELLRVVDFATDTELVRIPTADEHPSSREGRLALSADGTFVALATSSGALSAWEVKSGALRLHQTHVVALTALAFAPSGPILSWTCRYDPTIHRWDVLSGKEMAPCPGHEHAVQSLAFGPDGKTLVSSGLDERVRFWRGDPWEAIPDKLPWSLGRSDSLILGGRTAVSRDGRWLALARDGKDMQIVHASSGKMTRKLLGSSKFCCVAFSPDGRFVAGGDVSTPTSTSRGRLHLWDVATGKAIHVVYGHGDLVRAVAFSPDSKTVATGSDGVRLWDVSTGVQVRRFPHGRSIDAIAFTPDGKAMAAAGQGAVVWEVATGKELLRTAAGDFVSGLAVSPDGRLLATGGRDKIVRLWDLATGTELVALTGHLGVVHVLAFTPDGKHLASGSADTTILIWDVHAALAWVRDQGKRGPRPADFDALWSDLARADAAAAHKAIWTMASEPARTVAYLESRLKPADKEEDAFLVPPGDSLRYHRGIEILERIGTPEAKALLDKLARGPASRASREASAALRRLERLRPVPIRPRHEPTDAERLEQLWRDLGDADAATGHRAIWDLVGDPERATALLKARLEPAAKEENDTGLLVPAGPALRGVRAVAVLEHIASEDARKLLEVLAAGPPARLTREARAALERLKQRK
jgi:WD40 repeat protein